MTAIEKSDYNSHFLQMCRLASYGFACVPGTLFIPGLEPIEYEFEPAHGVRVKQMVNGKMVHKILLFSDLFARHA